jgi:hypothetical protein
MEEFETLINCSHRLFFVHNNSRLSLVETWTLGKEYIEKNPGSDLVEQYLFASSLPPSLI